MWDSKNQKLKGSTVPKINNISNQKNEMLQEMKMKFDKQIRDYDGLLTYEVVTSILNGDLNTREKQIKEIDFIEYCQKLYRNKLDQGRIAYSYWFNKFKFNPPKRKADFFCKDFPKHHRSAIGEQILQSLQKNCVIFVQGFVWVQR